MPGSTPGRGYPYPLPLTPPDGAVQIEALARAVDTDMTNALNAAKGSGAVYATPAARDAALPSPAAGMTCYVTSLGQSMLWAPPDGWTPVGGLMPGTWARFGSSALGTGSGRIAGLTPTVNGLTGGLTFDVPTGLFTTPYRGRYAITNSMRFQNFTGTYAQSGIGTDSGLFLHGGLGAKVASDTTSVSSGVLDLLAGAKIGIWYTTDGAGLLACEFSITYIGKLN